MEKRHEISDEQWKLIEPHLPGQAGQWGGIAKDNRNFINAVFWILRTGAPWRDLPSSYGRWHTVYMRFNRWVKSSSWENIFQELAKTPDFEWLILDGTHIRAHLHASGAKGGNQDMERTKGGLTQRFISQWTHKACQSK